MVKKGKGPHRLNLLLRVAHRQGFPVSLAQGIDKHAYEFHDRLPYLEGGERFGSIKCKISYDLGSPNESHYLDIVNFN